MELNDIHKNLGRIRNFIKKSDLKIIHMHANNYGGIDKNKNLNRNQEIFSVLKMANPNIKGDPNDTTYKSWDPNTKKVVISLRKSPDTLLKKFQQVTGINLSQRQKSTGLFKRSGTLESISLGNMLSEAAIDKTLVSISVTDDAIRALGSREIGKDILEKGFLRSYGLKNTMSALKESREARKLIFNSGMGGAMRFANPILTAAAVYDISKMAATAVIGGGARFARDAMKSMQGSINKPAFGMGYVDNEVAATSRARGVSAIQNSRLNARSALGSEAGMMASHFG